MSLVGISERTSGVTKFSHLERLGTNAKTTDPSGAVVDSRSYDAFGLPTSITNPTNSQQGFASAFGYQEDAESGLKLLGHRYYDPATGRFITRDPIGSGTNWYRYADNNPLKCVDPTGLKERPLSKDEANEVATAIYNLDQQGEHEAAAQLRKMLEEGKITVDDEFDKNEVRAETHQSVLSRLLGGESIVLSVDFLHHSSDADQERLRWRRLQATLYHEWVHVSTQGYMFSMTQGPGELAAYRAEVAYLRRQLKRKGLSRQQRDAIEELISDAILAFEQNFFKPESGWGKNP